MIVGLGLALHTATLTIAHSMIVAAPAVTYAPPPLPPSASRLGTPARARANLALYVTQDDYPVEAIRNGEQGIVAFQLDVGRDGRVTRCAIIGSSGSPVLDSTTCRLMRSRARFSPALDRQGRPMEDTVMARINWQLPRPMTPDSSTMWVTFGPGPALSNCRVEERYRGEVSRNEDATCSGLTEMGAELRRHLAPWLQQSGRPTTTLRFDMRTLASGEADVPTNPADRIVDQSVHRLEVGADGKVQSCDPKSGSANSFFASGSCDAATDFDPERFGNRPTTVRMVQTLSLVGEGSAP